MSRSNVLIAEGKCPKFMPVMHPSQNEPNPSLLETKAWTVLIVGFFRLDTGVSSHDHHAVRPALLQDDAQ